METGARRTIALGAAFALLGVVMGALGAHVLKSNGILDVNAIYRTSVQYHLFGAMGILIIGVLRRQQPASHALQAAAALMAVGITLFCGAFYHMAFTETREFSLLMPFGGLSLILAWALVIWAMLKR